MAELKQHGADIWQVLATKSWMLGLLLHFTVISWNTSTRRRPNVKGFTKGRVTCYNWPRKFLTFNVCGDWSAQVVLTSGKTGRHTTFETVMVFFSEAAVRNLHFDIVGLANCIQQPLWSCHLMMRIHGYKRHAVKKVTCIWLRASTNYSKFWWLFVL